MSRFYDRAGEEITLEQWSDLLENEDYRRVARTEFAGIVVSTVWLGMEHHFSFGPEQPDYPVAIFETMIFGGELDQEYQVRYGTEAAALDGHEEAVKVARAAHGFSLPEAVVERPVQVEDPP